MKIARIVVVIVLIALGLGWFAFRTESKRSAERAAMAREAAERSAVSAEPTPEAPPSAAPAPVAEPESPTPVAAYSPEDPVGIVVYGSVRAPDGTLVAESWIGARADERTFRRAPVTEGSFSLAGLRPGSWVISCELPGVGRAEKAMELAASVPLVRLDLVLEESTLVFVRFVCPDGTRLADRLLALQLHLGWSVPLVAVATRDHPGAELPRISHRSHEQYGLGVFRAKGGPGRDLSLDKTYDGVIETAGPPPYIASAVLRHIVLDSVSVAPGDTEVVFTISEEAILEQFCRVRVRVLDSMTGEPLTNARVEVSDSQSAGGGSPVDELGSAVIERKMPGPLELVVNAPDHERYSLWFNAEAPETDLGEIRLDPATSVQGLVVDEAGNPIACALTWFHLDRFESQGAEFFRYGNISARSETDGTFTISSLGRGRYLIFPDRPHARSPTIADTRGGSIEGLVVRASAGVEVKILTGADPTAPLAVRVNDHRGFPVRAARATGPVTTSLAPGRYSVRVDDGARVRSATFTVGSEPLEVTVAP